MSIYGPKGAPVGEANIESGETMVSLGEYGDIHQITADVMGEVEADAMSLL